MGQTTHRRQCPAATAPVVHSRRVRPLLPGPVALVLRTVVVLVVVVGVLWVPDAPASAPALTTADLDGKLRYFTIQSNLLLALVLAWSVVAGLAGRRGPSGWLVGGATFCVTVTFLVYNTVLAPGGGPDAVLLISGMPSSDLLHVVAPLLALLDWVLGRRHPGFTVRRSLLWLLYPLVYLGVSLLVGSRNGFYPYFFMDPAQIGGRAVAVYVVVLLVLFAVLALLFAGLDRLLGRGRRTAGDGAGVAGVTGGTSGPRGEFGLRADNEPPE